MNFRDKKLIVVHLDVYGKSDFIKKLISYNQLEELLNKQTGFWTYDNLNFFSVKHIVSVYLKYCQLEDIEELIKLEERNEEVELILARKNLIDKYTEEIDNLRDNGWYSSDVKYLDEAIEELKRLN